MAIKLITDSSCDLPKEFVDKNNIDVLPLLLNIEGNIIEDDFEKTLPYKDFYNKLREGCLPTTAQINAYTFDALFRKHVSKGEEVVYIGISSNLSGTFNSAFIAKQSILEDYPEAKINLIDSKSVSLGQGLIVVKVNELIKEGKSSEEIIEWVENNNSKVVHAILVEDLDHLKRGGRISGAAATLGGLLNIKPILQIDDEGKLVPRDKIKGKKKALRYIVNMIKEKAINSENETLYIAHGDDIETAQLLRDMILEEVKFKDTMIRYVGVSVGAHGGPGIVAAVFLANNRY